MGQNRQQTEIRDGMKIEWDVPIEMEDGTTLRCDVYRPIEETNCPVIMSHGPYGKWYHFKDRVGGRWDELVEEFPEVTSGTSTKYLNWEVVDPERWVPDGYAVVRVDSRGGGRSPGHIDIWSHQEAQDYAECIEWAGSQPWSNGKVGLNGISYYAMNQWQVAALQPDHLAAMCIWEGAADLYRDVAQHGGITCTFVDGWYEGSVLSVQHGKGSNGPRSRFTGDWVAGPETVTNEELGNAHAGVEPMRTAKLATDEYWTSRNPDWSKVEVPLLSAANYGHSMHLRGNTEGFLRAASDQKWLEIHGRAHWTEFYTDYGVELQKRFFGHFLKGEDTGWSEQPRVQVLVRHPGERFEERHESEWPLPTTDWSEYYIHPTDSTLSTDPPETDESITYDALGDGVTFLTDPLESETEFTGPVAAKLFVSSDTEDADLFLVLRAFYPDMEEVVYQGAVDPYRPISLGWLRASHRKLDEELSTEWRPYHTHDEVQPITPGEICELDIEIWPTSFVAPPGFRLGLSVRGRDYEYPGDAEFRGKPAGVGPFRHDDPEDRPVSVYGGDVTIHTGPDHPSHVLLPIINRDED